MSDTPFSVSIVVATFGAESWRELARRAVASAEPQAPTIHVHAATLAAARNEGLARAKSEFVIFLDADDELAPGYVEAMATGSADLRAPAVSYVRRHRAPRTAEMPKVAGHRHDCTAECLPEGNWLVIGSCARTALMREIGGFEEWPLYEDWAAWLRCWERGATVEAIPQAVYVAHVRPDSRNRAPSVQFKNQVHQQIVAAVLGAEAA